MRLTLLITIILAAGNSFLCNSQNITSQNAHARAHQQQLAHAKSRLDQSVIRDLIKKDIERREFESVEDHRLSSESKMMIQDLLKEARAHIGKRYRSGGKGPTVFDCSGFSSYVYRQFGYKLGASSKSQYFDGEEVERKELRPGDLVFFSGRNRNNGVGHVGIVVTADNEKGTFNFIHASTSKGVRIDAISDGYYSSRYIGARRIINY